ncbi:MAG: hypothetical protein AB7G80_09130 [Dongiaceae bacterium]
MPITLDRLMNNNTDLPTLMQTASGTAEDVFGFCLPRLFASSKEDFPRTERESTLAELAEIIWAVSRFNGAPEDAEPPRLNGETMRQALSRRAGELVAGLPKLFKSPLPRRIYFFIPYQSPERNKRIAAWLGNHQLVDLIEHTSMHHAEELCRETSHFYISPWLGAYVQELEDRICKIDPSYHPLYKMLPPQSRSRYDAITEDHKTILKTYKRLTESLAVTGPLIAAVVRRARQRSLGK